MTPRLKELYYKEIQPALKEKLGFKNTYQGPKVVKVVINMGLGLDGADTKIMKSTEEDLGKITGQKPVVTKFKKSVANFKTRKGSNAGLKVTLRGNKMYEFIDRLVNIALPRIKDFRGLSPKGFDKFGNYTFGIASFTAITIVSPMLAYRLLDPPKTFIHSILFAPVLSATSNSVWTCII